MYMKDGLHLSGKGAAVFADGLTAAIDSGMGNITNIFGSKYCLNYKRSGSIRYASSTTRGQEEEELFLLNGKKQTSYHYLKRVREISIN